MHLIKYYCSGSFFSNYKVYKNTSFQDFLPVFPEPQNPTKTRLNLTFFLLNLSFIKMHIKLDKNHPLGQKHLINSFVSQANQLQI